MENLEIEVSFDLSSVTNKFAKSGRNIRSDLLDFRFQKQKWFSTCNAPLFYT